MCFMVLSAMSRLHQLSCVDSIVTDYSSSQGANHLPISSFGVRKCRTVCRLKCVVFMATMKQWSPRVQGDLGGLGIVCIICCTEISVWVSGCSVFFGVSLHFSRKLLQCISRFWMTEKVEGGTKYSSVPKRPPSSVNCLRGPCAGTQAWGMRGVSVLHRRGEWCLVVNPIVSLRKLTPCMI